MQPQGGSIQRLSVPMPCPGGKRRKVIWQKPIETISHVNQNQNFPIGSVAFRFIKYLHLLMYRLETGLLLIEEEEEENKGRS